MSHIESLEVRRLFVVNGTAGNDVIEILAVSQGDAFTYRVVVNGATVLQETAPDDTFILDIDALGGDDLITTDSGLLIKVRARGGDGASATTSVTTTPRPFTFRVQDVDAPDRWSRTDLIQS